MNESAARRVGVYEIGQSLGSGGMGEVYRGRDTRLDRQVAVKFLLESAQARLEQPAADALDSARRTLARGVAGVEEVLGDVRRISHGLRPTMLDTLGLVPAMKQVVDEFAQRSGVVVDMQADADIVAPGDAGTALFRLLQEALNNIERHARASRVELRLGREPGAIVLSIRDDGRGFDVEAVSASPQRGLGLSSMRERVEALGGRFDLSSGGSGTLLSARLPVV